MDYFTGNNYEDYAELLKALGHPIRLCIVKGLLDSKGCNVTKIQDCLAIPQSTISQHLAKLKNAGIITGDRQGLEITYRVNNPIIEELISVLFKNE
ncbi:metalloregulator ArsR/SmtB family transcription factor [Serpentinicella sp. ANB-PHB4]|uniref:ArsR/SmtB family transcription factor n=1 Tax=Serpentinicella sp. ANB-PHB4 TaxID=3074076 RepID=UPI002865D2D2|nr:metalloregulator ArsR/SmtB family transcription factor [Serpentinicella sp. ANB-PHB4]MDR5658352.1 metalloregulator ArsR/SmtB family transcription factor [Serpentinicella sp. ANB-PHB4]